MYPGRTQGLRLLPPGQEKTVPKDGLFFASDQSKIADISQNAAPNANIRSEAMVLISFAFVFWSYDNIENHSCQAFSLRIFEKFYPSWN